MRTNWLSVMVNSGSYSTYFQIPKKRNNEHHGNAVAGMKHSTICSWVHRDPQSFWVCQVGRRPLPMNCCCLPRPHGSSEENFAVGEALALSAASSNAHTTFQSHVFVEEKLLYIAQWLHAMCMYDRDAIRVHVFET